MTDEQKWKAVSENDDSYNGVFFYAVTSTGIFCRPSCKSKLPCRDNALFFENARQAREAGFRPCKRCRPDLLEYQPVKEIAEETKLLINRHFAEKHVLEFNLKQLGVAQHRMVEIFKEQYGITVKEYMNSLRIEEAKAKLANEDEDIIEIAYSVGYKSLTAFYCFFRKYTGTTPAEYRKVGKTL